jgi:hypothetical protein
VVFSDATTGGLAQLPADHTSLRLLTLPGQVVVREETETFGADFDRYLGYVDRHFSGSKEAKRKKIATVLAAVDDRGSLRRRLAAASPGAPLLVDFAEGLRELPTVATDVFVDMSLSTALANAYRTGAKVRPGLLYTKRTQGTVRTGANTRFTITTRRGHDAGPPLSQSSTARDDVVLRADAEYTVGEVRVDGDGIRHVHLVEGGAAPARAARIARPSEEDLLTGRRVPAGRQFLADGDTVDQVQRGFDIDIDIDMPPGLKTGAGLTDAQRAALADADLLAVEVPAGTPAGIEAFVAALRLTVPEAVTDQAAHALGNRLRTLVTADAMSPPGKRASFTSRAQEAAAEVLGLDVAVIGRDGTMASAGGTGPTAHLVELAVEPGRLMATEPRPDPNAPSDP